MFLFLNLLPVFHTVLFNCYKRVFYSLVSNAVNKITINPNKSKVFRIYFVNTIKKKVLRIFQYLSVQYCIFKTIIFFWFKFIIKNRLLLFQNFFSDLGLFILLIFVRMVYEMLKKIMLQQYIL